MMPTKAENDISDVHFILTEITRFIKISAEDLMAHLREHKYDSFFGVPHPSGHGSVMIGEAANRRFYDLATRCLSSRSDQNDFDIDLFADAVKKEFVWRFLKKGGVTELTQQITDKLLSASVKRARRNHKALTHLIPCVLVSSNDPQEFTIGPVVFVRMEKFLQDHRASFEAEKESIRQEHIKRCEDAIASGSSAEQIATPEQSKDFAYGLVAQTIGYFEKFNWVAKVSIPECDVTISRKRAERTVEAALDILKLFFRRSSGKYLRQGHSLGTTPKTAHLTREADGKFDFSLSWGPEDAFTDNEWLRVLTESGGTYLRVAGEALDSCVDPQRSSHLKERFLDAMAWYGQAISELQTSVQIVKYVAALERLTVTRKIEEGLTDTVVGRSALLSYDGTTEGYEQVLKEAEKVYDCRSDLMHGSRSPFDKGLELVVPLAERIARNALFGSLRLFVRLDQEIKQATAKDLEAKYKTLGV